MERWNFDMAESLGAEPHIIDAVEIALELGERELGIVKEFNAEVERFHDSVNINEQRRAALLQEKKIFAIPTVYVPSGETPILGFTGAAEAPYEQFNHWGAIEPLLVFHELQTPLSSLEKLEQTLKDHFMFLHCGRMFCAAHDENAVLHQMARLNQIIVSSIDAFSKAYPKNPNNLNLLGWSDHDESDMNTEQRALTSVSGIEAWIASVDTEDGGEFRGFTDFNHNGEDLSIGLEEAARDGIYPQLDEPGLPEGIPLSDQLDAAWNFVVALAPHLDGNATAESVVKNLMKSERA